MERKPNQELYLYGTSAMYLGGNVIFLAARLTILLNQTPATPEKNVYLWCSISMAIVQAWSLYSTVLFSPLDWTRPAILTALCLNTISGQMISNMPLELCLWLIMPVAGLAAWSNLTFMYMVDQQLLFNQAYAQAREQRWERISQNNWTHLYQNQQNTGSQPRENQQRPKQPKKKQENKQNQETQPKTNTPEETQPKETLSTNVPEETQPKETLSTDAPSLRIERDYFI